VVYKLTKEINFQEFKFFIIFLFIILTIPSNIYIIVRDIYLTNLSKDEYFIPFEKQRYFELFSKDPWVRGVVRNNHQYYLNKETIKAMNWLRENSKYNDVVISSPQISLFIPGILGNKGQQQILILKNIII
jgi:hypothetical protein